MIPIFIFFSALYLIIVSCMFSTMYLVNKDYHISSLREARARETFGERESGGRLRAAATAVDVDGGDPELVPVTRRDVADLRRRQRRLYAAHTHTHTFTTHTHHALSLPRSPHFTLRVVTLNERSCLSSHLS